MKPKFNMISGTFSHTNCSTVNRTIKEFEWDFFSQNNNISFYIDSDMIQAFRDPPNTKKYLWTLESPEFNNNAFEYIYQNMDKIINTFDLIFTYNDNLIKINEKFKWIPAMGTWIKDPQIYNKSKLLSMISSSKSITPQQKIRAEFARENGNKFDLFGAGFRPITNKEEGLVDYMFSICIENITFDTYFTEKILDCFATGTIPIYKGTKNISKHFDIDGIIFLDDITLDSLTPELYYSKIKHIQKNFQLVKKYMVVEDYIFDNYLKYEN